jgi:predicted MFS family arabinose efflux permease
MISGDTGGIIRSFHITGDSFIAVTDTASVQGDFRGMTAIDEEGKKYSAGIIIMRWLVFACGTGFILSILLLFAWIYVYVFERKFSEVFLQSAMIVFIVLITTAIVLQIAISTLTGIYRENTFSNLKYISQLSKKYIDGDLAAKVKNRGDFMNSDYVKLREQLHAVFNDNNDEWNADYYGGLYTLKENNIYVLMFFDDSSGVNFPYRDNYKDSPFAKVIDNGEFVTVEENDVYGSWIYALSPVYDSKGKISAVLEVGKDLSTLQGQIRSFITGITKEIITVLIILVLFMLEITIFRDILHRRDKKGYGEGFGEFGMYSVHTVRMLAFIIAFSYALPVCYTPLMMKDILARTGTSIFGLSEGIAMAVPISAEMLGTALFAVIAGHLVEHQGWKRPFIYGTIFMSAGAFIAYYMNNPYLFILARFLVGAAYGLALVTLQCYPMISSNIETRNSGLASQNSGLNAGYCCGVAIGGLCADYMGYSAVYVFSVITAITAIPYARYLMSSRLTSGTAPLKEVHTIDVLKFFTSRNVFFFFTAAFIPVSICSMFLTYMFPVFAQEKGISAGDIGRVFMLNSLVIIYIGPAIVNFLTKRKSLRGKYTMALYMLVTLTGLLVFGLKPAVITAVIIILFVGLGDSFGLPMSNDYLIGLRAAARIGYDKSVGYLNFVGNIGQMIGPVLMGYLFTMGYQKGTYYILAGMTAAMLIFFTFSRNEAAADE